MTPTDPRTRVFPGIGSVVASVTILWFAGCAAPISVVTTPPGATAVINQKSVGKTPTQVVLEGNNPVDVELTLDGYFPEHFSYAPAPNNPQISAHLEPRQLTRKFAVTSAPDGATLALDGAPAGATPQSDLSVVFTRDRKDAPWRPRHLQVAKPHHQTEELILDEKSGATQHVELALLHHEKIYSIMAANGDSAELNAEVTLNGAAVGRTPLQLPVVFERRNKLQAWPKFTVAVRIPGKYKSAEHTLEFRDATTVAFKLETITEIPAKRIFPTVVMTPTGAQLQTQQVITNAPLNTREPSEIVGDLKPVTNLTRQDLPEAGSTRAESVNSYCVTPDGQNIVFGLTERDDQGNLYSNLFIKRADDSAGGVSRLTQGTRYWDSSPYIANDGSNYLVFSSNRGDRSRLDIFRFSLVDNRLSGGVSRLTNDGRFNYQPNYGDSNRQLFYLSTEADFPKAEPQISSIRIDGSLPTQLSFTALEVNNAFAERIYFVKIDPDTKKKQIYSITADGKLETALLNQEDFRKANCFNPAVSADGSKVLFVSDRGADEQGRPNNDIYIVNSDGTNPLQLTQNGSDDLAPSWSPAEERVVFFLSNRGGAYNVWRMKLSGGGK